MRIKQATIQSTTIPVARPHKMAIGTTQSQENVIVTLRTADGVYGVGEAPHMVGHSQEGETPATVRVTLRERLIPLVLGREAREIEAVARDMDAALPGNQRAKGAVVMAMYDLFGKVIGQPVADLLGGRVRDAVPLSWSLPIADEGPVLEEATRMVERGFRILKAKLGRPDPRSDVAILRALRREFDNEVRLRADANQAYDLRSAVRVLQGIEELDVDFLEQPVHRKDLASLRLLATEYCLAVPIMVDESAKSLDELATVARMKAANEVSIYVTGPGLLNAKKMAALVEAHRMRAYVGGALESAIGGAGALALAGSSPAIDRGCEMYGQFLLEAEPVTEPLTLRDGALVVPDRPGLGIELDNDVLEKYREGEVEQLTAR